MGGIAHGAPCPAAKNLPQVFIDDIRDPDVPVFDTWQVFWGDVPLSDSQLAQLAGDVKAHDVARKEMKSRGRWVYVGMLTAAAGTAISSVGWVVFGKNAQPSTVSLPMALGGMALGLLGMLVITESIQTPLEPHLAPTPRHRFSRAEVRRLVSQVNNRLYREICSAVEGTRSGAEAKGPRRRSSDG